MAYKRKRKYAWQKQAKKTIHNQHKPFNPGRYGKVWGSIEFLHTWGRQPEGDSNGPVIGKLRIGGKDVELTFSETNKIMETLRDAQHVYNVGVRLGRTNQDAGSTMSQRRYNG
tara:strand:+ start:978 stop:1316 length:339 start_codon:yes stop_codon:yes gene_type:complete